MNPATHWEAVYRRRPAESLSWFEPEPVISLAMIERSGIASGECAIDVGAGASRLVDCLLERGWRCVTVLDASATALAIARQRLGERAEAVEWLEGDVREFVAARRYALWHDRAVFHFLTAADDRRRYLESLRRAVLPGAAIVLSTFAEDGPERCSELPVERYSPERLAGVLGPGYTLEESRLAGHRTPGGAVQRFCHCRFRAAGGPGG